VTESGPRTTSVRRILTVATALVAGQAVLCGVIGWVTFGSRGHAARPAVHAAEPLLGPPIVVPPVSVAPVAPAASPAHRPRPAASPAPATRRPTFAPATHRTAPPSPIRTVPSAGPAPRPPTATVVVSAKTTLPPSTSAPSASAPSASASPGVQGPVEVGQACGPVNARGVTADGTAVRCVRNDTGELVWQLL
jgi:hypothetical protein